MSRQCDGGRLHISSKLLNATPSGGKSDTLYATETDQNGNGSRMMKNGYASPPSSSPPTPSSPLPISVGPGNHRYSFSSSQSPSPPFSPPASSHTSAENLPLLHAVVDKSTPLRAPPLAFSLDRRNPSDESDSRSSCLKDL
ncbi:hypothetical protein TEA_012091 [Camellia sinensis var. sinensis]|uniref:Uncharacterized protein n=1 Tax=Camellia sinensis var. sinensis TaxID=542762 RepID=A0A4S4EBE0_CAMSN|nr:hypothetical protein TEA_012091 [Camellia sinensis var. sinensis]